MCKTLNIQNCAQFIDDRSSKYTGYGYSTGTEPHLYRIVSEYFAILKNVAHSLEPGETQSNPASHEAQNNAQRSYISQNMVN